MVQEFNTYALFQDRDKRQFYSHHNSPILLFIVQYELHNEHVTYDIMNHKLIKCQFTWCTIKNYTWTNIYTKGGT